MICAAVLTWQNHKTEASEQKLTEEARAYRVRAEQGDAEAESNLGYMYARGQGVPQDFDEALRWRRKAADQSNADSEDGLGYMYSQGLGVPQDYIEALRWYRKAADQGDADGENAVALMYEQGHGVPQDYAEALRWYHKAVDQGYAKAQYNLGNMYYYGRGVPQDLAEADLWYHKAADQGDEYAQSVLRIKWKNLNAITKLNLSVIFLASMWALLGSVIPGGSFRTAQHGPFTLVGILGLSYIVLDLCGLRYIGAQTPLMAVGAFEFVKILPVAVTVPLLFSTALPHSIWPKVAKVALGLFGILFLGLNILVMTVNRLRTVVPTASPFWKIDGMLLGTFASLAIFLWLTRNSRDTDRAQAEWEPPAAPPE